MIPAIALGQRETPCQPPMQMWLPARGRGAGHALSAALAVLLLISLLGAPAEAFLGLPSNPRFFAVDPDFTIRQIDPRSCSRGWLLGTGWGLPPLFFSSNVNGLYHRCDFLYPLGCIEESPFRSKTRFTPLVDCYWSKTPPFEGYSRWFTAYWGRSDMGQDYWGLFPFYGYSYRHRGVDSDLFVLFPLYYESRYDNERTIRVLWPFITYANSPGRHALKAWPLVGHDIIGNEYENKFFMWPFFQKICRYPGTLEASTYTASPFPLYARLDTPFSTTVDVFWPLITYYHHYRTGHRRYSFRPFFTYGTGGGIKELSIFYVYSQKTDYRKGTGQGSSSGYIAVGDDEVFTEKKFLCMSSIQKRYRKGCLVYAQYKFWPFAEYSWDAKKGSHLKIPELTGLKSDWWDLNLGRLLRLIDIRDTPITRELSYFFGLSQHTELKPMPYIPCPPKPGEDSWTELLAGSFGKR